MLNAKQIGANMFAIVATVAIVGSMVSMVKPSALTSIVPNSEVKGGYTVDLKFNGSDGPVDGFPHASSNSINWALSPKLEGAFCKGDGYYERPSNNQPIPNWTGNTLAQTGGSRSFDLSVHDTVYHFKIECFSNANHTTSPIAVDEVIVNF